MKNFIGWLIFVVVIGGAELIVNGPGWLCAKLRGKTYEWIHFGGAQ